MDALNASDVVGRLLPDEAIQVTAFDLAPVGQLVAVQKLVKATHKQLNLDERVLSQTFMLF